METTLGSYPAAFIWLETLLDATDDADARLLLAWWYADSSERLISTLAELALLLASSVNDVYDLCALSAADVADLCAASPADDAEREICDGATPWRESSDSMLLLAWYDADDADLVAWA